jgi:hypothetical protein
LAEYRLECFAPDTTLTTLPFHSSPNAAFNEKEITYAVKNFSLSMIPLTRLQNQHLRDNIDAVLCNLADSIMSRISILSTSTNLLLSRINEEIGSQTELGHFAEGTQLELSY